MPTQSHNISVAIHEFNWLNSHVEYDSLVSLFLYLYLSKVDAVSNVTNVSSMSIALSTGSKCSVPNALIQTLPKNYVDTICCAGYFVHYAMLRGKVLILYSRSMSMYASSNVRHNCWYTVYALSQIVPPYSMLKHAMWPMHS